MLFLLIQVHDNNHHHPVKRHGGRVIFKRRKKKSTLPITNIFEYIQTTTSHSVQERRKKNHYLFKICLRIIGKSVNMVQHHRNQDRSRNGHVLVWDQPEIRNEPHSKYELTVNMLECTTWIYTFPTLIFTLGYFPAYLNET